MEGMWAEETNLAVLDKWINIINIEHICHDLAHCESLKGIKKKQCCMIVPQKRQTCSSCLLSVASTHKNLQT